jgi:hypothetical protein
MKTMKKTINEMFFILFIIPPIIKKLLSDYFEGAGMDKMESSAIEPIIFCTKIRTGTIGVFS